MASSSAIPLLLLCLISISLATTCHSFSTEQFLQCLQSKTSTKNISQQLFFPNTTSYSTLLLSSISNARFTTSQTSKPLLIFTPSHESHIQASVLCSKTYSLSLRVRSGGHDLEGLSYRTVGNQRFIILDLTNFRSVTVDIEHRTALVEAGATVGDLYYQIAKQTTTLGFPAGTSPTVGVGGQISAGGVGTLVRKYGLAADNVLDVRLVDVHGRILDKDSMGEDLFWAVRGGGAVSFCVVLSWKLRLVPVPQTVTLFNVAKSLQDGAIDIIDKWQHVAYNLPEDLFIETLMQTLMNGTKGAEVFFNGLYLGKSNEALQVMNNRFPELGVNASDLNEMSWIQSVLSFALYPIDSPIEILTDRSVQQKANFKAKSDYAVNLLPRAALKILWDSLLQVDRAAIYFEPYGGKMAEIPEFQIPFPHRKGSLFSILYLVAWTEEAEKNLDWVRNLYNQMTPYVSKNPRGAYLNYRDLDLGRNEGRNTSYSMAEVWGRKYFKSNFLRLTLVKGEVDPADFFWNEQSIPPLVLLKLY
ncbi:berberine bridge enzyme-like 18 [Dioscorea cayenensis subsp. rotundata]|uniref:Berberine bridge enzyme-like 18 n=1 Tax=Dioscorea cayennensis subsp. rotundata TaxID=55577 RepID=A0AB40AMJ8_DIOCR|nr:berberine bridge enzyme-like 18 [Dioscorea cayenensis subsp. rotundata]